MLLGVVDILASFFGRGVGARVERLAADGDLGAVGLVDDTVDLLEVVGVRDQLVAGDDVLSAEESVFTHPSLGHGGAAVKAVKASVQALSYLVDNHIGGFCESEGAF